MARLSYAPAQVIALFDEMARTYGAVNLISSFGFSHLWRKACVDRLAVQDGHRCADLMCGMGEATTLLLKTKARNLRIDAVDFSAGMVRHCIDTLGRAPGIEFQTKNVFDLPGEAAYDRICCSFGLKTFDDAQLRQFANLLRQLLKAEGKVALVEIHVPSNRLLRAPYLFYLRHVIPLIGALCLGNPDCYRHLALYTEAFARRDFFGQHLREAGFQVREASLLFGCARLYVADRPKIA